MFDKPTAMPALPNYAVFPDSTALHAALAEWFKQVIQLATKIPMNDINLQDPITDYALDSVAEVEIIGALSDWLAQDLSPYILYQHPTITDLIDYLVNTAFTQTTV